MPNTIVEFDRKKGFTSPNKNFISGRVFAEYRFMGPDEVLVKLYWNDGIVSEGFVMGKGLPENVKHLLQTRAPQLAWVFKN